MSDYSWERNDMTEAETRLYDLEGAGYWKSEHSGIWYEKHYKKAYRDYKQGEIKIYNWEPVEDEVAIEILEAGMVPSFEALNAR